MMMIVLYSSGRRKPAHCHPCLLCFGRGGARGGKERRRDLFGSPPTSRSVGRSGSGCPRRLTCLVFRIAKLCSPLQSKQPQGRRAPRTEMNGHVKIEYAQYESKTTWELSIITGGREHAQSRQVGNRRNRRNMEKQKRVTKTCPCRIL